MEVVFLRQAHKFIRTAGKSLRARIREEVTLIQQNPNTGEQLTGKLKGIYSHHFSYAGVQYRLAYKVVNNIVVIAVGSRENFYKKLEK